MLKMVACVLAFFFFVFDVCVSEYAIRYIHGKEKRVESATYSVVLPSIEHIRLYVRTKLGWVLMSHCVEVGTKKC